MTNELTVEDALVLLQVSRWYVVLNGQLRLVRESDTEKLYHVGEW